MAGIIKGRPDLSERDEPNDDASWLEAEWKRQGSKVPPRKPGVAYVTQTLNEETGKYNYFQTWWPWRKEDLDPNDTVTFIPMPIPMGSGGIFKDKDGQSHIKVDVNDLVALLPIGREVTTNSVFYHAYKSALDTYMELEKYKHNGPSGAPWGREMRGQEKAWMYQPSAFTFGLDIDGSMLTGAHTEEVEVGEWRGQPQFIMMTKEQAAQWYAGKGMPVNTKQLAEVHNDKIRDRLQGEIETKIDYLKRAQKILKKPTKLDKLVNKLKRKK